MNAQAAKKSCKIAAHETLHKMILMSHLYPCEIFKLRALDLLMPTAHVMYTTYIYYLHFAVSQTA